MDITGKKVKHNKFGIGVVSEHSNNCIYVDFDKKSSTFEFPKAFEEFLSAEDDKTATAIAKELEIAKAYQEKERLARQAEMDARRLALEEATQKNATSKQARGVKAAPPPPRVEGKQMAFLVFQGNTFSKESQGGYIWKPLTTEKGTLPKHWANLLNVRGGDVIIHCDHGLIKAVSIAKDACHTCPADEADGIDGRMVDCDYTILEKPTKTSMFVEDIIRLCDVKYAPFDKDGNGNKGYLFELHKDLACLFIKESASQNPYLKEIELLAQYL